MEQIPEIRDSELSISITRRYHSDFEVAISYGGSYIKRYTLVELTTALVDKLIESMPLIGKIIRPYVSRVFLKATHLFSAKIKMDVAESIFSQGADR